MTSAQPPQHDVRMKGFAHRALVEEAVEWIESVASPLGDLSVPLDDAVGRVLAEDVTSGIDVPGFDRSAMDGYALQAPATDGASLYNPLTFELLGQSLPGAAFAGSVTARSAVRIMTGAPVPDGADCVVPAEHATESGGSVEITQPMPPGRHIGRRGEDVQTGQVILSAGRQLRPQDVGLLASVGQPQASVHRPPVVRLLITGDELVPPGGERGPGQIYESNSVMLTTLASRDGGRLETAPPVPLVSDERNAVRQALASDGADLILVSGGSSVGAEDHAPSLLAELGELTFHGIAIRPASPAGMGRIGRTLVFLLPGNPVSCLCAYDFFAGVAIRRIAGRDGAWPYRPVATELADKIVSAIGRVDYCRVSLEGVDAPLARPLALSGASILSSTTRADGFVVVPAESEGHDAGTTVTTWLYGGVPVPVSES